MKSLCSVSAQLLALQSCRRLGQQDGADLQTVSVSLISQITHVLAESAARPCRAVWAYSAHDSVKFCEARQGRRLYWHHLQQGTALRI